MRQKEATVNGESESDNESTYSSKAAEFCKISIFIWCLTGWIYAGVSGKLFWMPGILVFFPGIFVAGLIAAVFFIPMWFAAKKAGSDWYGKGKKDRGFLTLAMVFKIGISLGPIVGAIYFVRGIRGGEYFLKSGRGGHFTPLVG